MGPGDVVIADPGLEGSWVALTFSTVELGSVVVPSTVRSGIATAAAVACGMRRPRRGAVAVTTGPVDRTTIAAIDAARHIEAPLVLEVWSGSDGSGVPGPSPSRASPIRTTPRPGCHRGGTRSR